ncbi:2-dehydro-3-deoxyphosphogluconate aldolase / (4S)-4-hydroxy-2-oxoglutarate aldolase [Amphibacillus marinus]|uniref:2-dehydro-3-deoxyphosphogluconate aldolase / (4S)-4-hydroxy-2-oxoglutarate aldolase n=1 Tax=Amphibacillus marinus TaxID=872970 RepID=A0A1H8TGJ2_9BACI|nr:bifunctional 4-hydroxy-2-oxoglutarate aldolase/2-dehydro-3-deoxy-phosphogluconate aldolase [Amphibacillus marinus]SEO89906.1 2-dehydro-3-deoxyphosphogluconate aldolase / (4S)-4-hydroxy-2-oxoglutarate aldolase [Amphibacillus marinus]
MQRLSILTRLADAGVVAVIRGKSVEQAFKACQAIVEGDMKALEVTFTLAGAEQLIKQLKETYQDRPEIVIGAGTVLDATTARLAILAGAEYIVSPGFDKETAKLCNLYQIPYLPGCQTINDVQQALTYGVDIVKLFPGNLLGPDFVKAVKGPLPHVSVMPSGGVDLDNIGDWVTAGSIAVGIGGNLTKPADQGNYAEVTKLANAYQKAFWLAKRGGQHD